MITNDEWIEVLVGELDLEHHAIECVRQYLKGFRVDVYYNCHPNWTGGIALRAFTEDGNPVYAKIHRTPFSHADAMRFVAETRMVIDAYNWKLDYPTRLDDLDKPPIDNRRLSK